MSELTLKVTIPVLEEMAKRDEQFVVKLSHAAAKEIGEKYSSAIVQSAVVREALERVDAAIVEAQRLAGAKLEHTIGEWDNRYKTGYRLRTTAIEHIEQHFQEILVNRFKRWLESTDVKALLDKAAHDYVEERLSTILKKSLSDFLGRRC